MNLIENIGFAAAACTTLSFIPQLTKIRKQGGRDLSYGMLGVYLIGLILWLAYGIFRHAAAVIVANAASIVLVAAAIVMKATVVVSREAPREAPPSAQIADSESENPRPIVV